MTFTLQGTDLRSAARAARITTDHGTIETPVFMPVGTAGTVKGIHQKELREVLDVPIILGNTYHLYLRPSVAVLEKAGGLHRFMGWERNLLTDSGGYQVYSLAANRKIKEGGVTFKSHIDGSSHTFTPESVMDIQRSIGADIIMAFDECAPYPCDYAYAQKSMKMTHGWLDRCLRRLETVPEKYGHRQSFFPIVQGSVYPDLRQQSAEYIAARGAEGNAIGGLSVGEPAEIMYHITELVCDILPKDKPRYLMGVGTPANILESIARGVDMFDCVMPTRNGRNGMLFTMNGTLNIKNKKWETDFSPIDETGEIFADTQYTKAYLRHLFVANEWLGKQIASLHNLAFYKKLVREARSHILTGDFYSWKNAITPQLSNRL